jgi:hypothetical protein
MKFSKPANRAASGKWQVTRVASGWSPVTRHPSPVSAFTLAEVLAAMLFLAIVIPAAIEALHVAGLAGEVAARKGVAARIADRILNESLITTNWSLGTQSGTVTEGAGEFHWTLSSRNWPVDTMQLLTADVTFSAQGHDYSVSLSTLANLQMQPATTTGAQP